MTEQTLAVWELAACVAKTLAPPPKWTVSQWADHRRRLSGEASAEQGQWRTSRAEYQRGIMDAICDPALEMTVVMSSAQVGKSEMLLNAIGYFVDFDASPILVLQPNLEMAETFSKDRIAPMLRDSPTLRGRVRDPRARDAGNTTLHKRFPGGHVTLAGANAPASLASRPIRVLLMDEVDRYPASAGTEGDPMRLAMKRTNNFWNRRVMAVSTPTVKGFSRIENEWSRSDRRFFFIPCPHCGSEHVLKWGNVVWPEGKPDEAAMKCPECNLTFSTAQKNAAVSRGVWKATAPFSGVAGFHVWEAYSPWRTLAEIVRDFLASKDDPSTLQVWVNTCLGETWEEAGDAVQEHDLISRCEVFPAEADIPQRGLVLTAGIDTQPDRLEVEVVAWAGGEESWSIDYRVIFGDPDIPEGAAGSPWNDLTDYLRKPWRHESGGQLVIEAACIDSGGHNTQAVYQYAKRHRGARVFAVKGKGGPGVPIVGNPSRRRAGAKTKRPVDVYIVGVDQAKSVIMKRLKLTAPGPGYCHFPMGRATDYFKQLTAEKMLTKFVKGFPRREWVKASGQRNEALDCRVYAFAALVLRAPQFDKIAFRVQQRAQAARANPEPPAPPQQPQDDASKRAQDDPPAALSNDRKTTPRKRARIPFISQW